MTKATTKLHHKPLVKHDTRPLMRDFSSAAASGMRPSSAHGLERRLKTKPERCVSRRLSVDVPSPSRARSGLRKAVYGTRQRRDESVANKKITGEPPDVPNALRYLLPDPKVSTPSGR